MTKKISGMKNPINKGGLQHVFSVLVVLLLASALLVGATSAAEFSDTEYVLTASDFLKNKTENGVNWIEIPTKDGTYYQTYTLTESATGNIKFHHSQYSGDILLRAKNGAVLTGFIHFNYPGNATVENMSLVLTSEMVNDQNKYTVAIAHGASLKRIIVENTTFNFVNAKGGQALQLCDIYDGTRFSNNIIYNATHNVVTAGGATIEGDVTLKINGNTVFMKPTESVGVASGRALLKVHHDSISEKVTYNVYDNIVSAADGVEHDASVVRFDDSGDIPQKINLNMWNNTLYDIPAITGNNWKDMQNGYYDKKFVFGHQLGSMKVWDTEEKRALVLAPSLNMTNVEWDGNTVNISAGGDYVTKTDAAITLSADTVKEVKINGVSVAPTIKVEGERSIQNDTSKSGELTASATSRLSKIGYELEWSTKDDEIIGLTINDKGAVTYTPKKVGTATVTVKAAGGAEVKVTVSVFEATEPKFTQTAEVKDNGNVTLPTAGMKTEDGTSVSDGTSFADETPVVIQDANSGVNITLTYEAGATVSSGKIEGNVSEMEVNYPENPAEVPKEVGEVAVTYNLILNLDAEKALNGSIVLPKIDPAFDNSVAEKIDKNVYKAFSMITATANGDETTSNLTENGIEITFFIEGNHEGKTLKIIHIGKTTDVIDATPTYDSTSKTTKVTAVSKYGFSSYVLAEYVYVAKDTGSSSSSSGSSVWLTETPTETPTPTPTETVPTDTVPTDIPSTQPTEEPSSPGFGILAVLAGLGAVAVLRRK